MNTQHILRYNEGLVKWTKDVENGVERNATMPTQTKRDSVCFVITGILQNDISLCVS